MTAEGYSARADQSPEPYMNIISPNYFATLGVPILQGRDFTIKDTLTVQHGMNDDGTPDTDSRHHHHQRKFAKKLFPGRNPLGLHLGFGSDPGTKTDMEIIGVVKDIKYTSLRDEIPVQAYIPYLANSNSVGGMTVYLRTTLEPEQIMGAVRRKVQNLDPNIPVYAMRTTQEQIDLISPHRASGSQPLGGVRRAGDTACSHRFVWRDGLHGCAPHPRNRHSHGSGCRAR